MGVLTGCLGGIVRDVLAGPIAAAAGFALRGAAIRRGWSLPAYARHAEK